MEKNLNICKNQVCFFSKRIERFSLIYLIEFINQFLEYENYVTKLKQDLEAKQNYLLANKLLNKPKDSKPPAYASYTNKPDSVACRAAAHLDCNGSFAFSNKKSPPHPRTHTNYSNTISILIDQSFSPNSIINRNLNTSYANQKNNNNINNNNNNSSSSSISNRHHHFNSAVGRSYSFSLNQNKPFLIKNNYTSSSTSNLTKPVS